MTKMNSTWYAGAFSSFKYYKLYTCRFIQKQHRDKTLYSLISTVYTISSLEIS